MNQMLVAQVVVAATNRSTHHHLLLVVGVSTCLLTISLTHSLTISLTHSTVDNSLDLKSHSPAAPTNSLASLILTIIRLSLAPWGPSMMSVNFWTPALSLSECHPAVYHHWLPEWGEGHPAQQSTPGNLANSTIKRSPSSKLHWRGDGCVLLPLVSPSYMIHCFQCRPPMSN